MRRAGASGLNWFQAGYEARMLAELGWYQEAEDLCKAAEPHGTEFGLPGVVNVGLGLCPAVIRRGRYDEARQLLDYILPSARRLGGGYFAVHTLTYDAELEEARGNLAAARQSISEAMRIVQAARDVGAFMLISAVRLLPLEQSRELRIGSGNRRSTRRSKRGWPRLRGSSEGTRHRFAERPTSTSRWRFRIRRPGAGSRQGSLSAPRRSSLALGSRTAHSRSGFGSSWPEPRSYAQNSMSAPITPR
jgi:hypothetical protein